MLRRKREELLGRWEEREARLARLRAREKALAGEQRGAKRRRVDDGPLRSSSSRPQRDDDDEWLLADRDPAGVAGGDDGSATGFSKETRNLMDKLGMGQKKPEEGDNVEENEVKVPQAPLPFTLPLPSF